ncbi:MAG: DUF503 domain-containing protein [Dethiobacter sp.]|jgi:uncharacterized protein YlxP (DUF503 family)|nr:DUF503 domain-containing protein [Dethiobacter sp.]MBS3897933.1 DUF503 domain-containing protein [Dethiobacter sp.]MBS3983681.1 DUF503 domain-containing protein [Dethiobacter sp.]MCL4462966.1 DUF503 domain-containing protein [Bacillota bacterium]MCL5993201.1 DUF503 domain-containing protein [Bacillota bacterium]
MVVGFLTMGLRLPGICSLKEKRSVLRRLIARIRQRFNVSVAEAGKQDKWQASVLTIVCVSANAALAHRQLEQVLSFVEQDGSIMITDTNLEIL